MPNSKLFDNLKRYKTQFETVGNRPEDLTCRDCIHCQHHGPDDVDDCLCNDPPYRKITPEDLISDHGDYSFDCPDFKPKYNDIELPQYKDMDHYLHGKGESLWSPVEDYNFCIDRNGEYLYSVVWLSTNGPDIYYIDTRTETINGKQGDENACFSLDKKKIKALNDTLKELYENNTRRI